MESQPAATRTTPWAIVAALSPRHNRVARVGPRWAPTRDPACGPDSPLRPPHWPDFPGRATLRQWPLGRQFHYWRNLDALAPVASAELRSPSRLRVADHRDRRDRPAHLDRRRLNGPGADFSDIRAAITAAAEGDIIRVRFGTYTLPSGITRPLTIVGENHPVLLAPLAFAVSSIPYDRAFVLKDLGLAAFLSITVAASSGRIHCDDVDFGSSTVSALTISDCQYVTLNRSGFRTRFRVLELDRPAGNRPVFDRSCFYDPSHLSTDGARAFSRYLAEQLVACEELPLDQDPPPRLLPSSGIVFAGKRAADGSNRIEFMADQLPFVGEAVVIASTEKRETRLPKGVRLGVPWPTPHVQALKRDSLYRASGAVEWAGIDPSKPLYLQLTVVEKDVVLGVSPVVELPPHR